MEFCSLGCSDTLLAERVLEKIVAQKPTYALELGKGNCNV